MLDQSSPMSSRWERFLKRLGGECRRRQSSASHWICNTLHAFYASSRDAVFQSAAQRDLDHILGES